jgi:hypothetical protein
MKSNGSLTTQFAVSAELQAEQAKLRFEREQLIELIDAQLTAIGGGSDIPQI